MEKPLAIHQIIHKYKESTNQPPQERVVLIQKLLRTNSKTYAHRKVLTQLLIHYKPLSDLLKHVLMERVGQLQLFSQGNTKNCAALLHIYQDGNSMLVPLSKNQKNQDKSKKGRLVIKVDVDLYRVVSVAARKMQDIRKIDQLKIAVELSWLPQGLLTMAADDSPPRQYKFGTWVCHQQQPSNKCMLLLQGQVTLSHKKLCSKKNSELYFSRTANFQKIQLRTIERGAIIGGQSLLQGCFLFSGRVTSDVAVVRELDLQRLLTHIRNKEMKDQQTRLLTIFQQNKKTLFQQFQHVQKCSHEAEFEQLDQLGTTRRVSKSQQLTDKSDTDLFMQQLGTSQRIMMQHLMQKKLMTRRGTHQLFRQKQNDRIRLIKRLEDSYSYANKKKSNTFIYQLLDSYKQSTKRDDWRQRLLRF